MRVPRTTVLMPLVMAVTPSADPPAPLVKDLVMYHRTMLALTLIASLSAIGSFSASAEPAAEPGVRKDLQEHPRLHRSIEELHAAIRHMKDAPHDFGGHRIQAIKACEAAITQLTLALESDTVHEGKEKARR